MANEYTVGQEYDIKSTTKGGLNGVYIFKGGDWKNKDNWVKPDTIAATAFKAGNFISGAGRYDPTIPEIGASPEFGLSGFLNDPQATLAASAGTLSSPDIQTSVNIIQEQFPGTEVSQDDMGNTTVVMDGKPYYINQPGLSGQDLIKTAFDIASFLGINKMIPGSMSGSIGGNALRAGTTGTALSAEQDVIADATGGQIDDGMFGGPVRPGKALMTGATTAAFQAGGDALFAAIPSIVNAVRSTMTKLNMGDDAVFRNGQLTDVGERALKQLGIEWNKMTTEFKARLAGQFGPNKLPPSNIDDAVRYAESQSLPVPVPQTRANLSGNPRDQLLEDAASKGVYGTQAQEIIAGAREASKGALDENVTEIQRMIAGASPVITRGGGGEAAQAELAAQRAAAQAKARAKYKKTEDLAESTGATIPPTVFKGFGESVRANVTRSHALDDLPVVTQMLDRVTKLGTQKGNVSISDLFRLRQQVTSKAASNFGNETGVALNSVKKQLDDRIETLADTALLKGEGELIKAWTSAIKNYKDFAKTWKSNNLVDRLTRKNRNDNTELAVAPEDAARYIFNANGMNFLSKAGLQRDLLKMKKLLTPDAWNGIRQEVYLRIVQSGKNAQGISGNKLLSAITKAFDDNAPLMSALFSAEEKALLQQFARVAQRTTSGASNTSNTAIAQATMLRDMTNRVIAVLGIKDGNKFMAAFPMLRSIGDRFRASQLKNAIDARPEVVLPNVGAAPGALGLIGN